MMRWFVRVVLLRFLPRRLLPILTVYELIKIARSLRRPKMAVNEPRNSRTARPPKPPEATIEKDPGTTVLNADRP